MAIPGAITDSNAKLVEHGMKYFTSHTLRRCHGVRTKYEQTYTTVVSLLAIFLGICVILWLKRLYRETPEERHSRIQERNEYLYTKMRTFNHAYDQNQVNLYG
jgi:hypothetical protein